MIEYTGRWELVAATPVELPETDYQDDDKIVGDVRMPNDEFNHRWLAGEDLVPTRPLEPATGLTLTITEDGTFTESGAADIDWFDEIGALDTTARPFDGTVVTAPGGTFLLTAHGLPDDDSGDTEDLRPRVADDTFVTDMISGEGDDLLRVMSVITDWLYPSRIRLAYRRA